MGSDGKDDPDKAEDPEKDEEVEEEEDDEEDGEDDGEDDEEDGEEDGDNEEGDDDGNDAEDEDGEKAEGTAPAEGGGDTETSRLLSAPSASASQTAWGWSGWASTLSTVVTSITEEATKAAAEVSKTAKQAAKTVADAVEAEVRAVQEAEKRMAKEDAGALSASLAAAAGGAPVGVAFMAPPAQDRMEASRDGGDSAGEGANFTVNQGLKALDEVGNDIASGAMHIFGNAWKGSVDLVHKLEHQAEHLAETIQQGGLAKAGEALAPSHLLETGLALTARAGHMLESVGKEALGLLAEELGGDPEHPPRTGRRRGGRANEEEAEGEGEGMGDGEELEFERCFYIYGGPEFLEELEERSNHYSLLCSRARAKLGPVERAAYDVLADKVALLLGGGRRRSTAEDEDESEDWLADNEESGAEGEGKEKHVDPFEAAGEGLEVRRMRDAGVAKAGELASGFLGSLGGLGATEVHKRTADRLDAIKTESIHRLSELCAVCVAQLVELGKAVLASSVKDGAQAAGEGEGGAQEGEGEGEADKQEVLLAVPWPEDCTEKARVIRSRVRAMTEDIQAVVKGFMAGIRDVLDAYAASSSCSKAPSKGPQEDAGAGGDDGAGEEADTDVLPVESLAEELLTFLEGSQVEAKERVKEGSGHLVYVVLSTTLQAS